MTRWCDPKGLTRVEIVVILFVGILVLSLLPVACRRARVDDARATCAANLAAIGKAMLVYANDYEGALPRAGGRNTTWGILPQWAGVSRYQAYGLAADGTGGSATISSCFYLLVKYAEMTPKSFVCKGDVGTTEFRLSDLAPSVAMNFELIDAWDFGPMEDTCKHCSYAYQMPFGLYALQMADDPHMPVAADRNPWLGNATGECKALSLFKPDLPLFQGTPEQGRKGNSLSHKEDGQNVLFLDGHVIFEERSYGGLDKDNVYLISSDLREGSPLGVAPVPYSVVPANRRDSILVHDPPALSPISYLADTPRPIAAVDSRSLKQTAVVATLDCPLPEHKNVIWCSTFQMAWDRLKRDVIGEPIQLPEAQDLAGRLNHSEYPADSIEERSYYAVAGFEKDGIIKQVQKEMRRRFPSEPTPVSDSLRNALPDGILAYAYLSVDVGFQYPYYACADAFRFQDSIGIRTGVTAFRAQTAGPSWGESLVRGQVEVLHYDDGQSPSTEQFAVDLSKETRPYQIVLARLPRYSTLGEAAEVLQGKIAAFKNDPDYEVLRKLRPVDTLIVPDVAYKLTHHVDELLGKRLGNPKWQGYFFFEATQTIDFSMSRTGMILKSQAVLRPATRSASQLVRPRHLHFDRPFLICVKKREPNATPFFLMWVDNAELLQPYEGSGKP